MQRLADGMTAQAASVSAALQPILAGLVARVNAATAEPFSLAVRGVAAAGSPSLPRTGAQSTRSLIDSAARSSVAAGDGGAVTQLQMLNAQMSALRELLAGQGADPALLAKFDVLIAAGAGGGTATGRTQRQRSLAALGQFG